MSSNRYQLHFFFYNFTQTEGAELSEKVQHFFYLPLRTVWRSGLRATGVISHHQQLEPVLTSLTRPVSGIFLR